MAVMEAIQSVLIPFLGTIFLSTMKQNVLLNRALDPSHILKSTEKRTSNFLWESVLITVNLFLTTLLLYPITNFLKEWKMRFPFIPLIYVLCIIAVYFLVRFLVYKFLPSRTFRFDEIFTAATFNCALIGSLLFMLQKDTSANLSFDLIYAIGAGIGYLVACILVWEGARRLRLCDIPKPFRGLPIMLIYIGILSLSIYAIME